MSVSFGLTPWMDGAVGAQKLPGMYRIGPYRETSFTFDVFSMYR